MIVTTRNTPTIASRWRRNRRTAARVGETCSMTHLARPGSTGTVHGSAAALEVAPGS